jgi:hypothetical protein
MNKLILTNRHHRNDRSAWKEQLDWILSKQKDLISEVSFGTLQQKYLVHPIE